MTFIYEQYHRRHEFEVAIVAPTGDSSRLGGDAVLPYKRLLEKHRFGLELLPEPDGEHLSNHIGRSMKQTHSVP
jgi:hypothetical protein